MIAQGRLFASGAPPLAAPFLLYSIWQQRAPDKAGKGSGKGRCFRACTWARFEVRQLAQVRLQGVRQHAETPSHRAAVRAYFAPPEAKVTIVQGPRQSEACQGVRATDAELFKGAVPQVADWVRAWRACRSPISFNAAADHGLTTNFIHGARAPACTSRRAFRSLVRILALGIRARKRAALIAAKSICLLLDDRGAYRLIRYKCDGPQQGGDALGSLGDYTCGCLGVVHRGGAAKAKQLEDLSDDYSRKMAESITRALARACASPDGDVDVSVLEAIQRKIRIGVADGGAPVQKALGLFFCCARSLYTHGMYV